MPHPAKPRPISQLFAMTRQSTAWVGQPPHVKLTWITLLLLADDDCDVMSSVAYLAKVAEVTFEECAQALALFLAPDRYNDYPSAVYEGRRIEEIAGGWHVLNTRDDAIPPAANGRRRGHINGSTEKGTRETRSS